MKTANNKPRLALYFSERIDCIGDREFALTPVQIGPDPYQSEKGDIIRNVDEYGPFARFKDLRVVCKLYCFDGKPTPSHHVEYEIAERDAHRLMTRARAFVRLQAKLADMQSQDYDRGVWSIDFAEYVRRICAILRVKKVLIQTDRGGGWSWDHGTYEHHSPEEIAAHIKKRQSDHYGTEETI